MGNLIITMMAITLFVVLSLFGVFEITPDIIHRVESEEIIESGFVDLVADYHAYKINNKDSDLNASNWNSFIDVPVAPKNTSWSYNSTLNGNYFCLSGVINSSQDFSNATTLLKSNFNTVFINNNCGATFDDTSYTNGDTKAFTIWLDSDYVSEGSAIDNDNVYDFSVSLREEDTGLNIISGDSLSFYKDTDAFIEVSLSRSDVVAEHYAVADTAISFVCSDGNDGCNTGKNRRIKLNASQVYENRKLTLSFSYNNFTIKKDIYLTSKRQYACNPVNPLEDIDLDVNRYVIGGVEEDSELARKQLLCISNNQTPEVLSANYVLTTDVTFAVSEDWDNSGTVGDGTDSEGWKPLGKLGYDFTGALEGGYNIINNLYINRDSDDQAFIGRAKDTTISNIGIKNVNIKGARSVGGLIGYSTNIVINNCYTTGNVESDYTDTASPVVSYAGGLAGVVGGQVNNSHSTANVSGNENLVGGLLGVIGVDGEVNSSYATGTVSGKSYVGGLVGNISTRAKVNYSYATGNVTGSESLIGGLAGRLYFTDSEINNCYASGNVSGNSVSSSQVVSTTLENKTINVDKGADLDIIHPLLGPYPNNGMVPQFISSASCNTGNNQCSHISLTNIQSSTSVTGVAVCFCPNIDSCTMSWWQGSCGGGTVNIVVNSSNVNSIGGLVGGANGKVNNCYATGNVSNAKNNVGGLIGGSSGSTIINSYATGTVSGEIYVGGLIGKISSTNLTNSYAHWSTAPSATSHVGGLVGYIESASTIHNESGLCEYIGVNSSCSPSNISTIQNGASYGAWSSDDWILGGGAPMLKNMPN